MRLIDSVKKMHSKLSPAKQALLEKRLQAALLRTSVQPTIPHRSPQGFAPLSYGQEGLWFIDQLDSSSPVYNRRVALRLNGDLDPNALQRALTEILQRHEVLRSSYRNDHGRPYQEISPSAVLDLPLIDLSAFPDSEREEEARKSVYEQARTPIDLKKSPLLRAGLIRLSDHEHILLLVFHHITYDAWSERVLFNELSILYGAFSRGEPSPLPELTIQYADYAAWQRERMETGEFQRHLSYWKNKLEDLPPATELETDHPRPAIYSNRGARYLFSLPTTLASALKDLGLRQNATESMVLLAAYLTFLYRYTHQNELLIGMPIAGRTTLEMEGLIGLFTNSTVLRCNLAGQPTFLGLLERVQKCVLEAVDHQEVPLEKLVAEINPKRDPSRTPFFQVVFNYRNIPDQPVKFPGLEVASYDFHLEVAPFDLTLDLAHQPETVDCTFIYNTDLYDAATIERAAGNFLKLLQSACANPDLSIDELPLVSEVELDQVLLKWNRTRREYPQNLLIHQLVEAQAARNPDTVAILVGSQPAWTGVQDTKLSTSMTYGELNTRANQIAHYLRQRGMGPESIVGVLMQRSPEMTAALLGVLKAGAAYLPLDPAYPLERLAFMLQDAGAKLTLSQAVLQDRLEGLGSEVIPIDRDWKLFQNQPDVNPENHAGLHNRAYIIYTSGSTGQPKGVELEHRGLLNLVHWHCEAFEVTAADRATQVAGLSFDASVWEIWPYLVRGARLYLLSDESDLSPERLVHWMVANAITIGFLPTPVAESVLNADWPEQTALRVLLTGGDRLRIFPPSRLPFVLVNNYGPTECTVVATSGVVHPIGEADAARVARPPAIGRPIANVQLYVLDSLLNPAPAGVAGELFIGGAGVGRGYLNKPELTAEKFIPNPCLDLLKQENGVESLGADRLFRTGDLVRYLPDGKLEFLGRTDTQVKLRGLRIELAEIEASLNRHPGVNQSIVLLREDGGEKYLAAYIVPQTAGELDKQELRTFMKRTLPEAMLPAAFVFLEAMPLTPNGKIDLKALPIPMIDRSATTGQYMQPRNELESHLCQIWEEVLNVHSVGINDNFFDLGGHSLLAIRLMDQVVKQVGAHLPLSSLFQAPTISGLAQLIHQNESQVRQPILVPIQPSGSRPPFFCVHGFGGGVVGYADLARALGSEQPFYGLQAEGLDGACEPDTTIEAMASRYVEAMRSMQPHGPYYLGGYCFGGIVAYEMARQLEAQDEPVPLLAIISASAPVRTGSPIPLYHPRRLRNIWRSIPLWVKDYRNLGFVRLNRRVRIKFNHILQHKLGWKEEGQFQDMIDADLEGLPTHILELMQTQLEARQKYLPGEYKGPIIVFGARRQTIREVLFGSLDTDKGWNSLARGEVQVRIVDGAHRNLHLKPYVGSLAASLSECLNSVQPSTVIFTPFYGKSIPTRSTPRLPGQE